MELNLGNGFRLYHKQDLLIIVIHSSNVMSLFVVVYKKVSCRAFDHCSITCW